MRRIEAFTGPAAARRLRDRERELRETAEQLRTLPEQVAETVRDREAKLKEFQKAQRKGTGVTDEVIAQLGEQTAEIGGTRALVAAIDGATIGEEAVKDLRSLSDRLRDKFEADVVVLGCAAGGRVQVVANVVPGAIERGIKAGALAKLAAETVGGGGGGRDNLAQAGGKDPAKLPQALDAVREAIAAAG